MKIVSSQSKFLIKRNLKRRTRVFLESSMSELGMLLIYKWVVTVYLSRILDVFFKFETWADRIMLLPS